ncbi:MAG: ROK family protein [Actinomycetota bacterium]|nr:ROK family protein [Actinomycetota bacterium]
MTGPGGLAAGVDLGGSNLRVGLVAEDGEVVWRRSESTPASHSPAEVADAIVRIVREGAGEHGVELDALPGVGIGIPGAVDPVTGVSVLSPNFGWKDVPFGAMLRERLGPKVAIDNDVSVVTYGEWQHGAGAGVADLMCVTVGTGVGSGLILRGEPYPGSVGAAGEIGHIQLDPNGPVCGCGNRGCLEVYASAQAVARSAQHRGLTSADGGPATAQEVAEAADRGDPVAAEILAGAASALAHGVAAAVNLLNLSRVVIGGGLPRSGEPFWAPFENAFRPQVMAPHLAHVAVVPAALGDDAGILGGAWMVRRSRSEP